MQLQLLCLWNCMLWEGRRSRSWECWALHREGLKATQKHVSLFLFVTRSTLRCYSFRVDRVDQEKLSLGEVYTWWLWHGKVCHQNLRPHTSMSILPEYSANVYQCGYYGCRALQLGCKYVAHFTLAHITNLYLRWSELINESAKSDQCLHPTWDICIITDMPWVFNLLLRHSLIPHYCSVW